MKFFSILSAKDVLISMFQTHRPGTPCFMWLPIIYWSMKQRRKDLGNNFSSVFEFWTSCDVALCQEIINQPNTNVIPPDSIQHAYLAWVLSFSILEKPKSLSQHYVPMKPLQAHEINANTFTPQRLPPTGAKFYNEYMCTKMLCTWEIFSVIKTVDSSYRKSSTT
jgi:hypothetical protein